MLAVRGLGLMRAGVVAVGAGGWSSDVCSSVMVIPVAVTVRPVPAAAWEKVALAVEQVTLSVPTRQIGRAACRERVEISVVAVSLKKKAVRGVGVVLAVVVAVAEENT